MIFLPTIIFLLSSLLTFLLTIRDIPVAFLQQLILLILLILIFFSKKIFSSANNLTVKLFKFIGLFFSALLTQLFVFSTGGFYSPFLILFHLYTLAVSFLLGYQSGIIFMTLSVVSLIFASYLNPKALNIFQDDPSTGLIYMISFLVVVPLAQILVKNYQIKDTIAKALGRYLQIGESREKSILQNLNELVIVTDENLMIVSINTAVEKYFRIDSIDAVNKDFLEIIPLAYTSGETIVKDALEIDKVLTDKVTYMLSDFYLKTPAKIFGRVVVQITPILDKEGNVEQIVFVITQAKLSNEINKHAGLEEALRRHKEIGNILKKALLDIKHPELVKYAELFAKGEEDLLTLTEIEDHPLKQVVSYLDVALLCQEIIEQKKEFAKMLNVPLYFSLPQGENAELIIFAMSEGDNVSSEAGNFSNFAVPIDKKWFDLIIKKLLEVSILLSSSFSSPGVTLSLTRDEKGVDIKIVVNYPKIEDDKLKEIFTEYYGSLGQTTSLRLGSGLEGFIAKLIADESDLVLGLESKKDPGQLIFTVKLEKNPR